MPDILPLLVIVFIVLTFAAAVLLFLALLLKRKPRKDVSLTALNDRQDLSGSEATYFQYIRYDSEKNAIVLKQSQVFKKCVVTLITKKGNARQIARYNLEYVPGDLYCGIRLDAPVDEYRVVLESVDGTTQKHAPVDSFVSSNAIYAIVVSVLFIVATIVLIMWYGSSYEVLESEEFPILYGLVLLVVIYPIVVIGGCLLGETLSKKGKF